MKGKPELKKKPLKSSLGANNTRMESVKPFLLRIFAFNTFMDISQKIPYKPYNSMPYRAPCVVHTEKAWADLGRTEQLFNNFKGKIDLFLFFILSRSEVSGSERFLFLFFILFPPNSLYDKAQHGGYSTQHLPRPAKFMFEAYRTSFNPWFPVVLKPNQMIKVNTIISILTREATLLLFR